MAYGEGEPGFNKEYMSSLFKDDNFLQLLSGLSQAVGTRNGKMGPGAQMGAMFSNQLQSENAQAAFEKQMKQKSEWAQIMSRLLGGQQQNPTVQPAEQSGLRLGPRRSVDPTGGFTSRDWMDTKGYR